MKAFIFAAGRGERMRPLTDTCPKPLLKVQDKPLLMWHIEGFYRAGFSSVIINNAWLGKQIIQAVGDHFCGMPIIHSSEGTALETAGAIAFAMEYLQDEPYFAAINGDVFCPHFDYAQLIEKSKHFTPQQSAHLYLIDNPPHNPKGDFSLQGNIVASTGTVQQTFSGIGIYASRMFAHLKKGDNAKLATLLRQHMVLGEVHGEMLQTPWHDIGTPERLLAADQYS